MRCLQALLEYFRELLYITRALYSKTNLVRFYRQGSRSFRIRQRKNTHDSQ